MLDDPGTEALFGCLPDWQVDNRLSGHSSPGFAPNLLNLLADMGVGAGDEPRVESLLDSFLGHQGTVAVSPRSAPAGRLRRRYGGVAL